MATKHHKYLISVHPKTQRIAKVQKVGAKGELVDVEPEDEMSYVPMVLSPFPKHRPKKKKKSKTKKKAKKKTKKKKVTKKKAPARKKRTTRKKR